MLLAMKRFWDKVDVRGEDECWEWTAGRHPTGYGRFKLNGSGVPASRVAWELANGPVPPGLCVCHSCDNPPCCNPEHLWLGTKGDNVRDASTKKRLTGSRNIGTNNRNSKLDEISVRAIKVWLHKGYSVGELASIFGVSHVTISDINTGKRWSHVPRRTLEGGKR